MVILAQIRRNRWLFSIFPYNFIHSTEEVEGSNPESSSSYSKQEAFAMSTISLLIYLVGLHPAPGNVVHFFYRCVER